MIATILLAVIAFTFTVVAFVVGYSSGKRFATAQALRVLRRHNLDDWSDPDRPLVIVTTPAAEIIGAVYGTPWLTHVQESLDANRTRDPLERLSLDRAAAE